MRSSTEQGSGGRFAFVTIAQFRFQAPTRESAGSKHLIIQRLEASVYVAAMSRSEEIARSYTNSLPDCPFQLDRPTKIRNRARYRRSVHGP